MLIAFVYVSTDLEPPCLSSVYRSATKTRHEIGVIWLWVRLIAALIKYQIYRENPSYIVWPSKVWALNTYKEKRLGYGKEEE